MARNPKQDANLKPYKKGELTSEEAKRRGRNGGKKSGEARRVQRDARSAARYILNLAVNGTIAKDLTTMGLPENEQTYMAATQIRVLNMALNGNLEAYKTIMRMAGYDSEEERKERESLNADKRRSIEIEAKVNALGGNLPDGSNLAVSLQNDEGSSDVVIYMPKIDDEKDCELPPEEDTEEESEDE